MVAATLFTLDAVLFDLDGVLTSTAALHRGAWRETFNTVLALLPDAVAGSRAPFTSDDYLRSVDGRPRLDGVRQFLASRGIRVPEGEPGDSAEALTVAGIGARKNAAFRRRLASEGVDVLPGSVSLLRCLRQRGKRTALVSASRNASAVLVSAGLTGLFDVQIDGEVAAHRGLRGKPFPDTFLEAAEALAVAPSRAGVVEDAISGAEAARAGGFGLVVGVDATGDGRLLLQHGADLVVHNLAELLPEAGC